MELDPICFSSDCASRTLFDQIADKWSMMVLAVLSDGPHRFNLIRKRLEGVSQKALTQCLRKLERNGLITRRIVSVSPVAVEYEITKLGQTLQKAVRRASPVDAGQAAGGQCSARSLRRPTIR